MRSPAASVASKTTKVDVACTGQNAAPWPRFVGFSSRHSPCRPMENGKRVGFPFVCGKRSLYYLAKKSQSIEQSLLKEGQKRWSLSMWQFFWSTFGGFLGHPSPIHRRSEVKGAVTSTRRLMKIAGLGLFIVIFVFVARRFFWGKLQIFLETSVSGSTLGEWALIPVEADIVFLLPQSLEQRYNGNHFCHDLAW